MKKSATGINVGDKFYLINCKHTWNNGMRVTVDCVNGIDDFDVSGIDCDGYKLNLRVGRFNLTRERSK